MFSSKTLALLGLLAPVTLAQYGGGAAPVIASTPTMTAAAHAAASSTSTSSGASSTQTIIAGKNGITDLTFTPNNVTAAPGTFVEFQFMGLNHSVAESAFATPCTPLNSSTFYSGFNFATKSGLASDVFTIQINSTAPVWFYCPQTVSGIHHCVQGMVGVINAPAGKTAADFATNARTATVAVPAKVQGGLVGPAKAASSGTSSSSSSASAASSVPTGSASHLTVGMGFMGLVGIGFSALLSFQKIG